MSEAHFRRWSALLRERAPDEYGAWTSEVAGLACALLRIYPDAAAVGQPATLDGKVWIAADARLDAVEDLRNELSGAGRSVSLDESDATLLLHSYAVWGDSCVEHILGDFAFAIWDGPRRRLLAARDHFGVRPLCFAVTENGVLVSSAANMLYRHPAVSRELDDDAIADILVFDGLKPEATAFRAIRRVPAAHVLLSDGAGVTLRRYWTLPDEEPLSRRAARESPREIMEVLTVAMRDRLRGVAPALLLSGGMDSTALAAVTAGRLVEPAAMRAYTQGYERLLADPELPLARAVAAQLRIPFEPVLIDDFGAMEGVEQAQWNRSIPGVDSCPEAFSSVMRRVADHGRLVIAGTAADGILNPDPLPRLLLRGLTDPLHSASASVSYVGLYGRRPPLGLREWLQGPAERRPVSLPSWINAEFAVSHDLATRSWPGLETPPRRARWRAARTMSPAFLDRILDDYTAAEAATQVTTVHPFLDLRVVRFCLRLPVVPWCWDKHVLRTAMRGLVPEPVRLRRKTPLGSGPFRARIRRDFPRLRTWVADPHLSRYCSATSFADLERLVLEVRGERHLAPLALDALLRGWRDRSAVD